MRRFWPRLFKAVLPVALLSGGAGYLYAVAAGAYFATEHDDGSTLRDALAVRLPVTMSLWGGGLALLVEWFRHLWVPPKKAEKAPASTPEADAEKLLLQLLEQAERAEQSRAVPVPDARPIPADPGQPTPAA